MMSNPLLRPVQLIALLLSIFAAGCSSALVEEDAPEKWRFAIEESEGSIQHAYALRFKQLIEQRTEGAVEVEVYPYGSLGTSTQMTEQLNLGVLEFAMASPGTLGKFIPEVQVFLLHFLLPEDPKQNRQLLNRPEIHELFDPLYAEKGLKLLSVFAEGEMVWTVDEAIRKPEDFEGVKFRVMTTPLLMANYQAYGASATPMPYSEVYSGLQLNMIDGQVNPVFAIERQKFYEVTDWMIFPGHAHFITTAAANRDFYEDLPAQRRELVERTIAELDQYIYEQQRELQISRMKKIIQERKRRRRVLNIVGDLSALRATLSEDEQRELLDENEYLNVTPPLSDAERQEFARRSRAVREFYLEIASPRGAVILEQLQEAIAEVEK